ncbi:Two-component response regulator ARR14 [Acorus calamus]|uniref:Two-component response regulator ARR14 n=1 Tax=Acorus calamus TaxID=4465 RepID=A0AAV9E2Z7_ACOCL|nr:Two-component response regulator ARR14 [Acorus calamus]
MDENVVTTVNGITNGACDYLLKPVKFEELKKIWQHVVRKSLQHPTQEIMESVRPVKRNKSEQTKIEEENVCKSSKKKISRAPRIVWDPELQNKFIYAVESLGLQSATPMKIMEIMNIPGLSTTQISSHLQVYRNKIQKTKGDTFIAEIQQTRELDQTKCYSSSTIPNAFASPRFISEMIQESTSTVTSPRRPIYAIALARPIQGVSLHPLSPPKPDCNINHTNGTRLRHHHFANRVVKPTTLAKALRHPTTLTCSRFDLPDTVGVQDEP